MPAATWPSIAGEDAWQSLQGATSPCRAESCFPGCRSTSSGVEAVRDSLLAAASSGLDVTLEQASRSGQSLSCNRIPALPCAMK